MSNEEKTPLEELSVKLIKGEKHIDDENFVDINNLTRQYFALMMNVVESPFLMSFLSHHEYKEIAEIDILKDGVPKLVDVALEPEDRWQVKTTPYTRALLSDGAIIYKASWNDKMKSIMTVEMVRNAMDQVMENDCQLALRLRNENKTIFSLLKDELKKLIAQDVYLDAEGVFGAINRYTEQDNNNEIITFSYLLGWLKKRNELFFVVPNEPRGVRNTKDFDVVTFIGKVFYQLSKKLKYKSKSEECGEKFDFIAFQKMTGCNWSIPQSSVIKLDPNLLWPKLDIEYTLVDKETKERENRHLAIGNIANGIKWKEYQIKHDAQMVNQVTEKKKSENDVEKVIKTKEIAANVKTLVPVSQEGNNGLTNFMTETVHEHGQTKAIVYLKDFLNDPNKEDIKKTVTFPYICGAFDLLTEIQFGEGNENLLMFTT